MAGEMRTVGGIEELLNRARSGDRDAEDTLFDRLHARILALAKRRIRDQEAARDLAQETMRTVFEKYREAELPQGLVAWVFTVLHNKVGNYLKRRRVETARVRHLDVDLEWETVGVSAEGGIEAIDLAISLERALRLASPECREIFRLLLEGAVREEIQEAFGGEPMGTIDSRIHRCRRKLLSHLEGLQKGGRV